MKRGSGQRLTENGIFRRSFLRSYCRRTQHGRTICDPEWDWRRLQATSNHPTRLAAHQSANIPRQRTADHRKSPWDATIHIGDRHDASRTNSCQWMEILDLRRARPSRDIADECWKNLARLVGPADRSPFRQPKIRHKRQMKFIKITSQFSNLTR